MCVCLPGILLGEGLLGRFVAADSTSMAVLFPVRRNDAVVLSFDTCCCSQPHLYYHTGYFNLTEYKTETRTMEENADDLPAEARDTEEERSSPKADTTAIQEDKQIPVESLEQTSQEVEARDEVQPHVELANVPLNGSKDDEQTDKDVSIAENEPESPQKEKEQ